MVRAVIDGVKEGARRSKLRFELAMDLLEPGLAALAGAGPVLELGVGTGRLAVPLAATGLHVHGVDIVRFGDDGLGHEHWGVFDVMAMMQQLGVAPVPATT